MNDKRIKLTVHVHPGATKNEITGYSGEVLNIRITARPEKGKANEALIKYLSDILGIAKSRIVIEKGATSRNKLVIIEGMDRDTVAKLVTG